MGAVPAEIDPAAAVRLHPDLRLTLKKLSKRDPTTKLRALEEFLAFVSAATTSNAETPADLNGLVALWPAIYNKLIADPDRRVRGAMARLHCAVVRVFQRQLAPILKEIIGSWIAAHCDTSKEVARLSESAFEDTFPGKRASVMQFCQSALIAYASNNILEQTPETLSDPRFTTIEDMDAKYMRIVVGSFDILCRLLDAVPPENMAAVSAEYDQLWNNQRLWACASHEFPPIRRAYYSFVKSIIVKSPDIIGKRLEMVSTAFLGKAFTDKTPSTHLELWDAVLLLTKQFPESWKLASTKKPVVNKLYAFLRAGAHGSTSGSYPCLLPLIATMPPSIIKENNCAFLGDFFTSFWTGLAAVDRSVSGVSIDAYLECIFFTITRESLFTPEDTMGIVHAHAILPLLLLLIPSKFPEIQSRIKAEDIQSAMASFWIKIYGASTISNDIQSALVGHVESVLEQAVAHGTFPKQLEPASSESVLMTEHELEMLCTRLSSVFVAVDKAAQIMPAEAAARFQPILDRIVCSATEHAILGLTAHPTDTSVASLLTVLLSGFSGAIFGLGANARFHSHTQKQHTKTAEHVFAFLSGPALQSIKTHPGSPVSLSLVHASASTLAVACNAKDSREDILGDVQSLWSALISAILSTKNDKHKFRLLHLIVTQPFKVPLSSRIDVASKPFNDFIVQTVIDGNPSRSEYAAECVAALIKTTTDASMLSERTVQDVIASLHTTLVLATRAYLVVINKHAHKLSAHVVDRILFSLQIICATVSPLPTLTRQLIPHLFSIVSPVFMSVLDLGTFHPATIAKFVWDPKLDASVDEGLLANNILATAKNAWSGMSTVVRHVDTHIARVALEQWLDQRTAGFLDCHHCGSPSDFVSQTRTLIELVVAKESRSFHHRIVECVILDRDVWARESLPFLRVDERMAIMQPIFGLSILGKSSIAVNDDRSLQLQQQEPSGMVQQTDTLSLSSSSLPATKAIQYDHDGLSLYARMVLCTIGLIKDKIIDLNGHDYNSVWVWIELVRFANICDTANALQDTVALPWNSECVISHDHLAQEIRQLLDSEVKRGKISLRECGKESSLRIQATSATTDTTLLVVAALDSAMVATESTLSLYTPAIQFEYIRAYKEILCTVFSRSAPISDDVISVWLHLVGHLKKHDGALGCAVAVVLAIRPYLTPSKSIVSMFKSLVSSVSAVERSALSQESSLVDAYTLVLRLNALSIDPLREPFGAPQPELVVPDHSIAILRRIRGWFDADLHSSNIAAMMRTATSDLASLGLGKGSLINGSAVTLPASPDVRLRNHFYAECARLILTMIRAAPPGIAMTNFAADLVCYWLVALVQSSLAPPSPYRSSEMVFLFRTLELWRDLRDASQSNPKEWIYVVELNPVVTTLCLRLFFVYCVHMDTAPPEPIAHLQSLICTLASEADVTAPHIMSMTCQDKLYGMLYSFNQDVQKLAWLMLHRITAVQIQTRSLAIEMGPQIGQGQASRDQKSIRAGQLNGSDDDFAQQAAQLSLDEAESTVDQATENINVTDVDVDESSVSNAPKSVAPMPIDKLHPNLVTGISRIITVDDEHTHLAFGCLLSWMIALDHFQDVTYQLKLSYTAHLRSTCALHRLLDFVFRALGVGSSVSRASFDLTGWQFEAYTVDGFEPDSEASLLLLCAHVYWRVIRAVPSLVRVWWTECKNRQLSLGVESFTERFYSPRIVQSELSTVQNMDTTQFEDLSVRVVKSSSEVIATYKLEEAALEIVIRLPVSFPLRLVQVESGSAGGRAAGVNESRWRAWLLGVSSVVTAQNGSMVDALSVFKKNVAMHFEGFEDCSICYSVIGVLDRSLPTKKCRTCSHLFHGSCLFKWFKSSNQSLCPLCRQPF